MLGCMNCKALICEEPCYPDYKKNCSKKIKRAVWDYDLNKWVETEILKELFCPNCRICDWSTVSQEFHRERANEILNQNQEDIAMMLDNLRAAEI